ncbi:MAG: DUF5722 domain-containing protein [Eubacteriales bacterium]
MKKNVLRIIFLSAALVLCALALSSCSSERITEIKSVVYEKKSKTLEIEATLDAKTARTYRHDTIYLIEVPANNTLYDITTLIPVSRSKPGKKMSFSMPLLDGARTRLYSGFVLAVFDKETGYVALGDIHYVDNPDALAENSSPYPSFSSIKGLSVASSSDAVLLGVKHTVIRIPIEEYILPSGSENARTTVFDGDTHYLSSEKIEQLDYKIRNLTDAGIEVCLEFTLDTSPDELPSELRSLASKKPSENGENESAQDGDVHYAISIEDGASYRSIAALFEFFAERYTSADGKYGFAGTYIIGHGVNSLTSTGIDDPSTLSESASAYTALLRLAHTALRSHYSEGRVFASFDNVWELPESEESESEESGDDTAAETEDESLSWQKPKGPDGLPVALRDAFGAKEYLTYIAKEAEKGGMFDFGVAVMPCASDGGSAVWNDAGAEESENSHYLTMKNIGLLSSFLSSERMLYSGSERNLLIYNYGISSDSPDLMAASYAFAYGKALDAGACAFIYNGQWDNATGNGRTGLWSTDDGGNVIEKRPIYNVFRDIDRADFCEDTLSAYSPGPDWQALRKKIINEADFVYGESSGATSLSDENRKKLKSAKTSILFDFAEGKSYEFYPSDSAVYIEMGELIGQRALKAVLAPKYAGENMGVRSSAVPAELFDGAKQLSAVLCVYMPEGNTCRVTLALSQSSDKGSSLFTSSATVQSGNRQTVYFDISDASVSEKLGDVKLYIWAESNTGMSSYYIEGGTDETNVCTLMIESLSLTVKKTSLAFLWVILVLLLATAAVFIGYRVFKRRTARRRINNRAGQYRGGAPRQGQRPAQGQSRPRTDMRGGTNPAMRRQGMQRPPQSTDRRNGYGNNR